MRSFRTTDLDPYPTGGHSNKGSRGDQGMSRRDGQENPFKSNTDPYAGPDEGRPRSRRPPASTRTNRPLD